MDDTLSGAAYAGASRLAAERGSSVLAVMAERMASVDTKIDQRVARFFRSAADARRGLATATSVKAFGTDRALEQKPNETRQQAYRRTVDELQRFAADPVTGMERRLGPQFAAAAPQAAVAMTAAATRANQYLLSKLPVPPQPGIPGLPAPKPTDAEIAKFARSVQAVRRPLTVLDEIARGTLAPGHVEGLRAVYPELYEDIRTRTYAALTEQRTPPPIDQRMQLGILLGIPTDPSLRPTSIAMAQATFAPPEPEAPPAGGGKAPNISKAFSSRTQELEGLEF